MFNSIDEGFYGPFGLRVLEGRGRDGRKYF